MTGERAFSIVQYGKESTRGTAVAATRKLLGKAPAVKSDRKHIYPERANGLRAKSTDAQVHQYLYTNTLSVPNGYFQALLPFFGCGVKGGLAPSETTPSQSDFLWNFVPSMTAANNPDALTLELGDDTQVFQAEYAMFEKLKLSWAIAQGNDAAPVSIEGDFFARQITRVSAFTSAIALPTVTDMNGILSRLYMDTSWAGIGTSEVANTLRSADVEILTGVHPKFNGGANKTFSGHAEGKFEVMLNVTLEGNAAADAIMDAHMDKTSHAVRLQINGPQIGSGTSSKLAIDVWGSWEDVSPLGGEDRGDNLHNATFHGFYDATGAKLFQASVITDRGTY